MGPTQRPQHYISHLFVPFVISILVLSAGCSGKPSGVISEQYEFDKDGRLISIVSPNGSKIKYEYGDHGLPIEMDYSGDSVKYGYDANGNRILMHNKNGETEYKYDAFNRLIEVICRYSPEKRIAYEYDPWNRISAMRIWDAQNNSYQVRYEYNILGNPISIDDGNGRIGYDYFPSKREVTRTLPNGIRSIFSYSPRGDLVSLKHSDRLNGLLASYRYEYNPSGQISRVFEESSEGSQSTTLEWDNRGYLKRLNFPNGRIIDYEYGPMGHRTSVKDSMKGIIEYRYDNLGRIIKAGDTTYEWGNDGSLMTQIDKAGKTRFRYDAANLPLIVTTPNETVKYKWDGDGNMMAREVGKDITYYVPNPLASSGVTLAEFDNAGRLKTSYLYGDSLLGQRDVNGKMNYFLEDGFKSIRHIADANGKVIGGVDYSPFAEPILTKGNIIPEFYTSGGRFLPEINSYALGGSFFNPHIGMLNKPYAPIGYRPQDFGNPIFDRARNLIEQGQRLPKSRGLTEKELRQREPEYYAMIDELATAPDITDINSLGRLMYIGTPGLIMSHWIRQGAIGVSFIDRSPISSFVAASARRLEGFFSGFINTFPGGHLITNQLTGLQQAEDLVNSFSSFWNLGRSIGGAHSQSFERYNQIYLGPGMWMDGTGQFRMDWRIPDSRFNPGQFVGRSGRTIAQWFVLDELQNLIGGEPTHTGRFVRGPASEADVRRRPPVTPRRIEDDRRKSTLFIGPDQCLGCPDHGGGGAGSQGGRFGGRFYDPLKSVEAKLGGIKLDTTAQFTGDVGDITGLVYDADKQVLVLVGDKNTSLPSIKPEDLAVALVSVFGSDQTPPQAPQFSLDPDDPKNPRGQWLKAVYIPERIIRGTEFGNALYEADWLLKQYSFGVTLDAEGKMHERKSLIPGLKSIADLSYEQKEGFRKESWNRFWIVPDEMILEQSGRSIVFASAKMRVKAKKQVPDRNSPTGLRDVDSEDDPIATQFKNTFTALYDQIAKESPEFEHVRQLAKAVAIAKWMKQEGIPFDAHWVSEYANRRITKYVARVTALSAPKEKRTETPFRRGNQTGTLTEIYRLYLFGGVDLTVKLNIISDNGLAQSLHKVITTKLDERIITPTFDVNPQGKSYHAIILPVTQKGQEIWKNSFATTVAGTQYQFNNRGEVTRSVDDAGNVFEYIWNADRRLTEFKIIANNGSTVLGRRKNDYSEVAVTNSRDHNFLYRYSPSGYLSEVLVNGQRYAAIRYDRGDTVIDYGGHVERFRYDRSGRPTRYEISSYREGGLPATPRSLEINYDPDGRITDVYIPDAEHVRIGYSRENIKTVSTSRGTVDYVFDSPGAKITQINTTWGASARYDYDGDTLKRITYANGNYRKEILFKNNLPIEVRGNAGISINYSYDSHNRLKVIGLPDGSSIDFQYEWHPSKDSEEPVLRKVKIIRSSARGASSPVGKLYESKSKTANISSEIPAGRLEDIREAGRNLKDGSVIDVLVSEKGVARVNAVDSDGNIQELNAEASQEFRRLLQITSTTHGKLGSTLLGRWQRFYDATLSRMGKSRTWNGPDGKAARIKPVLIIKSDEVNFKYANLERVPALVDNFIIFMASKETTATDLVAKINNIPKLSQKNTTFIIRLPDMDKAGRSKWQIEIDNLRKIVGNNNVLVDPTKEELQDMLQNRGNDIVAFELTHTDAGIVLKNGERYTSRDIGLSGDLSHIKYLVSGLGTCNLPRLEDGNFSTSLRKKGIGIINGSYGEVSSENALLRLKELINIIRNNNEYDLYPYHLIDIIDQRLGVSGKGTTNLGKNDSPSSTVIGNRLVDDVIIFKG